MSRPPSVSYERIIAALERAGWRVIRQKGSHIRLAGTSRSGQPLKLTVPAHKPVKTGTLAEILKTAEMTVEEFKALL